MDEPSFRLLTEILDAPGICGREHPIREILARAIEPLVDETTVDELGNLLAYLKGSPSQPRILLESHMDEIGFLVTGVDPDGYVLCAPAGYIDDRVVPGKPVTIYSAEKQFPGILVIRGRSEVGGGAGGVFVGRSTFAIDVGASSEAEVLAAGIQIGDQAVWGFGVSRLGGGVEVSSKALDARLGCYALVKVLERLADARPPLNITAAFTIQEEIGRKGGIPVVTRERPEAIITFDIMGACCPGYDPDLLPVRCGLGPGITIMQATNDATDGDGAFVADRALVSMAKEICSRESIPFQYDIYTASVPSFVTNAGVLYVMNQGIPTIQLCVGIKYMHSASETASLADLDNLIRLMEGMVMRLGQM